MRWHFVLDSLRLRNLHQNIRKVLQMNAVVIDECPTYELEGSGWSAVLVYSKYDTLQKGSTNQQSSVEDTGQCMRRLSVRRERSVRAQTRSAARPVP